MEARFSLRRRHCHHDHRTRIIATWAGFCNSEGESALILAIRTPEAERDGAVFYNSWCRKMLLKLDAKIGTRGLIAGILLTGLLAPACISEDPDSSHPPPPIDESAPASRGKIVAFGDSLIAGLGLSPEKAPPVLLQSKLDAAGYDFEVVNAGVPGDTSAGGTRRLEWILEGDVRILILALGANDGLRGLPVSEMRRNLSTIIARARARGIAVLLAGMEAPPNQGETYTSRFREAFQELERQHEVVFFPFLLEGVAGVAELNQADGIHPNAKGARVVSDYLWVYLQPMLDAALDR